jgi:hypothetical protein
MRRMKYFLGMLLAFLLLFNLGGVGYAGSPGAILVDRSHGQAAVDISGFTTYLESQEWIVTDVTDSITSDVLSGYGVFLLVRPSVVFTSAEVEAITSFVENGGGLWMLEDSAILIKSNSLASQFGVTFNSDAVINEEDYSSRMWNPIIRELEPHAITAGVSSFVYYGGCSLNVLSPAAVIATGGADAYSDRGIYGNDPPVLAAAEAGSGRAVFIGDMSALSSTKYDALSDEHKQLLANIVDWLNQGGENEPQDVPVTIDIKPGSNPNSINLKSKGVTPVAVLTTDDFAADTIDPDTVLFASASPVRSTMEDVDGDGDDDMLFHFKTQDLKNLNEDSTEATLKGETRGGTLIEGIDSVNIVPKGKKDKIGK